jgi:predicted DNA-binding transcriptional regulator AlpA
MNLIARRKNPSQHLPDSAVYPQLGISRATFYRFLDKGVLTRPVARIAKNRRGWTMADLEVAKQELKQWKERTTKS